MDALVKAKSDLEVALTEAQVANRAKNELLIQMETLANTDPLTGLFNRRYTWELGQKEFLRSRRYLRPFSVLMLDIDHFKKLNDTYGHDSGDAALKALVDVCIDNLRSEDVCGRWGGEEFLVILPETNKEGALQVAERLREKISEKKVSVKKEEISFTVSIGVAQVTDDDLNIRSVINLADKALYEAKNKGRNCVVLKDGGKI